MAKPLSIEIKNDTDNLVLKYKFWKCMTIHALSMTSPKFTYVFYILTIFHKPIFTPNSKLV